MPYSNQLIMSKQEIVVARRLPEVDQHPNQKKKQYVTNCVMFQLSYISIKLTAWCLNAGMEAQCSALLKVAENVHMRNCIMLQLVSLSSLLLAKACCEIFIKYVFTPAINSWFPLQVCHEFECM